MQEEYLAQVKFAFAPTRWANAVWHTTPTAKLYAGTLEEAKKAIQTVKDQYPDDPRWEVIESRILARKVTVWYEVKEEKNV